MDNIRLAGNSVNFSVNADDGRNMLFAVIFNVEQIEVSLDNGQTLRILEQPFFGGKNGCRNLVLNQIFDQLVVKLAGTGIKR